MPVAASKVSTTAPVVTSTSVTVPLPACTFSLKAISSWAVGAMPVAPFWGVLPAGWSVGATSSLTWTLKTCSADCAGEPLSVTRTRSE